MVGAFLVRALVTFVLSDRSVITLLFVFLSACLEQKFIFLSLPEIVVLIFFASIFLSLLRIHYLFLLLILHLIAILAFLNPKSLGLWIPLGRILHWHPFGLRLLANEHLNIAICITTSSKFLTFSNISRFASFDLVPSCISSMSDIFLGSACIMHCYRNLLLILWDVVSIFLISPR